MKHRNLQIELRNRRAKNRRVTIIRGSIFWLWHCPCCHSTESGFPKWEDALWATWVHISVWHATREQRKAS